METISTNNNFIDNPIPDYKIDHNDGHSRQTTEIDPDEQYNNQYSYLMTHKHSKSRFSSKPTDQPDNEQGDDGYDSDMEENTDNRPNNWQLNCLRYKYTKSIGNCR